MKASPARILSPAVIFITLKQCDVCFLHQMKWFSVDRGEIKAMAFATYVKRRKFNDPIRS